MLPSQADEVPCPAIGLADSLKMKFFVVFKSLALAAQNERNEGSINVLGPPQVGSNQIVDAECHASENRLQHQHQISHASLAVD
jgi:hypothetical protein